MIQFPVKVECVDCKQLVNGKVIYGSGYFDTPGFIVFDDGIHCGKCAKKGKKKGGLGIGDIERPIGAIK